MRTPLNASVTGEHASGCSACGNVFSGLATFDAHQQWDRGGDGELHLTCRDPAALGMEKNRAGRWRVPIDEEKIWWKKTGESETA